MTRSTAPGTPESVATGGSATFNSGANVHSDMSPGIRATVVFPDPGDCPVAACSADTAVEHVSTSVAPGETGSVTEFLAPPDIERTAVEPVFEYGTATLYRTRQGAHERCPCACLGRHGCPVHRYTAESGELTLVFHAATFEKLQSVMAELREQYPPVDVRRLLQPPLDGSPESRVFVDRGRLTDRQREALVTAYEMGYFERPRGANASEVAAALGIAQSTLNEHLVTAQRKLLTDILDRSV
jgi:predicted DNA binding protein